SPQTSGSLCCWRMMSCSPWRVCCCLRQYWKLNETRILYSRDRHCSLVELCLIRSTHRRAHRTHHGRCAAHLLLSRAFGMDGLCSVSHQLCRLHCLSDPPQCEGGHCCLGRC